VILETEQDVFAASADFYKQIAKFKVYFCLLLDDRLLLIVDNLDLAVSM